MLGSIGTKSRTSISITTATISATRSLVTSFIILQIIYVEFVRQIILVQAVVVERNLYTYYRLPTSIIKTSNTTQSFYVLQCPFRSTLNIPKPQEMGICAIVGRYRETRTHKKSKSPQEAHLLESAPIQLYTKVEYAEPLKTKKFIKIVKIKNVKSATPMMPRPLKMMTASMREMLMEKPRIRLQRPKWDHHQNDISNLKPIKYLDIKSSEEVNIEKNTNATASVQATKEKNKTKKDKNKKVKEKEKEKNRNKSQESSDEFDFDDEEDSDVNFSGELQMDATNNYSPLRLLNVKDAIEKLKLHVPPEHGDNIKNAEKFFAELNDYKRGFHTANYHNIYHRDELYNDHIIYDDLQQAGNYNEKQKVQEKQQEET